eukprot:PhM_4_TR9240/c0_g1_i3/m.24394
MSSNQWSVLSSLYVEDEFGAKKQIATLFDADTADAVALLFVRHLGCFVCRDHVVAVAQSIAGRPLPLRRRLVIVTSSPPFLIGFFRKSTGYAGEIYTDRTGQTQKALKLVRGFFTPCGCPGTCWSIMCFVRHPTLLSSDMQLLGGTFVFKIVQNRRDKEQVNGVNSTSTALTTDNGVGKVEAVFSHVDTSVEDVCDVEKMRNYLEKA